MTRPLRVGHLLSSASRAGGGVVEAVASQALEFVGRGLAEVHVFAMEDEHTEADRGRWAGVALHTRKVIGPGRFGWAPGLLGDLLEADLDILQVHGLWMYPSVIAPIWARRTGRPLVLSVHGMLDPWILGRGRIQKRLAMTLYERRNLRAASLFHALTEEEERQIGAFRRGARCVVIPNMLETEKFAASNVRREGSERFMLYLGRLHEKKNVVGLVEAWAGVRQSMAAAGCRLKIAGWGEEGYVGRLRAQIDRLSLHDAVEFVGPRFGADKDSLLGRAEFLLLPSLGEGLPMAVAEAWARGTPTAMSRFCNLGEGFAANAAVEMGTSPDEIGRCLVNLVRMDRKGWDTMSNAALGLARRRFHPDRVTGQWRRAYGALAHAGPA